MNFSFVAWASWVGGLERKYNEKHFVKMLMCMYNSMYIGESLYLQTNIDLCDDL